MNSDTLFPFTLPPHSLHEEDCKDFCLQFLISEIIHVFQLLKENRKLLDTLTKSSAKKIANELSPLINCSLDAHCIGSLEKIYCYGEILFEGQEKRALDAIQTLKKKLPALLSRLETLIDPKNKLAAEMKEFFDTLTLELKILFLCLPPLLKNAKNNENVLFLCLKLRPEINLLIFPESLEKILTSLFPFGFDELKKIIVGGYEKRGFLPFIQAHLHLLEI